MLCQNWPSFEEVGKPNVYLAVMETVTGNSFVSFACFLSNDVYKLILKTYREQVPFETETKKHISETKLGPHYFIL